MRKQRDAIEQCQAVQGEARGALLWALQLAEMPPYDRPFDADALAARPADGHLRPGEELEQACLTARLWHWRARTADLAEDGAPDLPERFASLDQAVASAAVRGHEQGLLPAPLRGDFTAYGKIYRHLGPGERAQAHAIAAERHHALAWLCGEGAWDDVPLDT